MKTRVLSLENVANDNDDFQYYTGLSSIVVGSTGSSQRRGPERRLSARDEFFLVLVRLRRGLHGRDLGRRFGVSEATVSRIWDTWIPFLADRLRHIDIWQSKESLASQIPGPFKVSHG